MNLLMFMAVLVYDFQGGCSPRARHRQMTATTADRIARRRLPGRGNHAATDVFWLSTVAIFGQPSILRKLIWRVATRLPTPLPLDGRCYRIDSPLVWGRAFSPLRQFQIGRASCR